LKQALIQEGFSSINTDGSALNYKAFIQTCDKPYPAGLNHFLNKPFAATTRFTLSKDE